MSSFPVSTQGLRPHIHVGCQLCHLPLTMLSGHSYMHNTHMQHSAAWLTPGPRLTAPCRGSSTGVQEQPAEHALGSSNRVREGVGVGGTAAHMEGHASEGNAQPFCCLHAPSTRQVTTCLQLRMQTAPYRWSSLAALGCSSYTAW